MKHVRRRVFRAIVVLCLLLSATSLGLAVESCFYGAAATWSGAVALDGHQNTFLIRPYLGHADIYFARMSFPPAIRAQYLHFNGGIVGWYFYAPVRLRADAGYNFRNGHPAFGLFTFVIEPINYNLAKDILLPINEHGWHLTFPLWWLFLIFGFIPAAVFLRRRGIRTRGAGGLCINCGYDLRATPDRCPECGTTVATAKN